MPEQVGGTIAEVIGVSTQAIRFYERRGLLRPADRLGNGYRHYDAATIDRVALSSPHKPQT